MKRKKFVTENYTFQSVKRIVLDSLVQCVSLVNDNDVFCDCLLGKYRGNFVVYREYTSPKSHLIFCETFNRSCCCRMVFEYFKSDLDALRAEGYNNVEACV